MTAPTQARSYNYQAIEDAWTKGKIAVLDSMPDSGKTKQDGTTHLRLEMTLDTLPTAYMRSVSILHRHWSFFCLVHQESN